MKYTAIIANIKGRSETIALVPAFTNGFEYARTYSGKLEEINGLIEDLVTQEIKYRLNYRKPIPLDVQYTLRDELKQYLPYDELEEGEAFEDITYYTTEER